MLQMWVHGEALQALGLDGKWLVKEAKILIRSRVIRTKNLVPVLDGGGGNDSGAGGSAGGGRQGTPALASYPSPLAPLLSQC